MKNRLKHFLHYKWFLSAINAGAYLPGIGEGCFTDCVHREPLEPPLKNIIRCSLFIEK